MDYILKTTRGIAELLHQILNENVKIFSELKLQLLDFWEQKHSFNIATLDCIIRLTMHFITAQILHTNLLSVFFFLLRHFRSRYTRSRSLIVKYQFKHFNVTPEIYVNFLFIKVASRRTTTFYLEQGFLPATKKRGKNLPFS